MSTSIDVAQRVYDLKGWVGAWRLEELTYYAQAWSLGWYGRELFADDFQAWCDGPVEPTLHHANKFERTGGFHSPVLPQANTSCLMPEQLAIIDAVLDFYGDMSKAELIDLTHAEQPWRNARTGLAPEEKSSNVVTKQDMKRFYALSELEGRDVPQRPFLSARHVHRESDLSRMRTQAQRWESALDILAFR